MSDALPALTSRIAFDYYFMIAASHDVVALVAGEVLGGLVVSVCPGGVTVSVATDPTESVGFA